MSSKDTPSETDTTSAPGVPPGPRVPRPGPEEVQRMATALGFHVPSTELPVYTALVSASLASHDALAGLPDIRPVHASAAYEVGRTTWKRPLPEENALGAWNVRCRIPGASEGPLAGMEVALKDTVQVAGLPMANGSHMLATFVPEWDAPVVTRLLDAGAVIVGKAVCENLCYSGGSHTAATGPVRNPRNPAHSAGGSSSGCAAVLVGAPDASPEARLALGGDQGGSVRIPSAFCGVVGMKPTHGLVCYAGVAGIEATLDHVGPMSRTVADNALMLSVLAGRHTDRFGDLVDARQANCPATLPDYVAAAASATGAKEQGLCVGLLEEGFAVAQPGVAAAVQQAASWLEAAGVTVVKVSVPWHATAGVPVWSGVVLEGAVRQLQAGEAVGHRGLHSVGLATAVAHASRAHMSHSAKVSYLAGLAVAELYPGAQAYAKAQNLVRELRSRYEDAMEAAGVDALLMPTLPMTATPLPPADADPALVCQRSFEMIANTAPFDATGHPAISVPCGAVDGLPVGAMLVGRHWQEDKLYALAAALEAQQASQ